MPEPSRYRQEDIEIYKEICTNIRVTDDISFRLLGAVPLASTVLSGGLLLLEKTNPLGPATALGVVILSLLGAMITIGLLRWELRNVRWCRWLICHAADFERNVLAGDTHDAQSKSPKGIQFDRWMEDGVTAKLPTLFRRGPWNKTEAEKLIYIGAIAVWLVPLSTAVISLARLQELEATNVEHVVGVQGKVIRLPKSEWTEAKQEFDWAVNFEQVQKGPRHHSGRVVTVFKLPMSADRRLGVKISDTEYLELFVERPSALTVQLRVDNGRYWVLSREIFQAPSLAGTAVPRQNSDLPSNQADAGSLKEH